MYFKTERLLVEDFKGEYTNEMFAITNDVRVNKFVIWNVPKDLIEVEVLMMANSYCVITSLDDGAAIGFCRLNHLKDKVYNIGYYLSPEHQGKGYATEVANGLIKYAFDKLFARKVLATCDPRNIHSERVMKRCGMTYEGHVREDIQLPCGKYRDSLYYSILKHEYLQQLW